MDPPSGNTVLRDSLVECTAFTVRCFAEQLTCCSETVRVMLGRHARLELVEKYAGHGSGGSHQDKFAGCAARRRA